MYSWNSISKGGFSASLPKTLAKELEQRQKARGQIVKLLVYIISHKFMLQMFKIIKEQR